MGLNTLGTVHDRVGDEEFISFEQPSDGGGGKQFVDGKLIDDGKSTGLAHKSNDFFNGVWFRFQADTGTDQYNGITNTKSDFTDFSVELGLDIYRHIYDDGSKNFFGVYFAYGYSDSDISGTFSNEADTANLNGHTGDLRLNGFSGGIYFTHFGPSGWYVDTVVQGTAYTGDATTDRTSISLSGYGIISSVEAGYPFWLTKKLALEPEVQLVYVGTRWDDTHDRFSSVNLNDTDTLFGRIGARLFYKTTINDHLFVPYVRVNFWDALAGSDSSVTYTGGETIRIGNDAAWAQLGAGFTYAVNGFVTIYGHIDGLIGLQNAGTDRDGVDGSIGIRVNW
jgi:outer membrane autotransporter protein